MGKSILELFKGSEYDTKIKPSTETFIEEESKGIRVKSLVDLNNPLIYGTDTIRITTRTTDTLEIMKSGTGGTISNGGLINKGITALTGGKVKSLIGIKNKISDALGIPTIWIPTRVANELGPGITVQDVLDRRNGTEFGKLLKSTGGGNPKTLLIQSAGTAVNYGKDKLRNVLFGSTTSIGIVKPTTTSYYTSDDTYTQQQTSKDSGAPIYTEVKTADDLRARVEWNTGDDLAKYSPIYGIDRNSKLYNTTDSKKIIDEKNAKLPLGEKPSETPLGKYSSKEPYSKAESVGQSGNNTSNSLEYKYGLFNDSDNINSLNPDDEYSTTTDIEKMDIIPFWIGRIGSDKKIHFRAILSGISETVSPTWSSDKFFGNPFEFHTYDSVSRSVSFTFQIYCSNEGELDYQWKRIEKLTTLTYPEIANNLVNAPIIDFRLGDIYNGTIGFIESLNYTINDSGTWEIKDGMKLPKFIEVSMSIKFIETPATVSGGLYRTKQNSGGSSTFDSSPKT